MPEAVYGNLAPGGHHRSIYMKAQCMTPAITVFDAHGNIDAEGNKRVYDHLVAGGVSGIVIMGSTGEFHALSMAMQKELIDIAVGHIRGRVRLLVGTSRPLAGETVELSEYAHDKGADGVMIVGPYYFALPDESVEAYFDAVAPATRARVYLYNYPDRTGYGISARVALNLARKHRNIVGFKDTITDMNHTCELIRALKPEFPAFEIFSGFDNNFAHNLLSGGSGCIGALSNLAPEIFAAWARVCDTGDWQTVMALQKRVDTLMELYSVSSPFIPAMKKAMNLRGLAISEHCTTPILPVDGKGTAIIRDIMERSGLL